MSGGTIYSLKGHGHIDPAWVGECFRLFKNEAVNIRKLVLLKNGHPTHFAYLEIHFTAGPQAADFLAELQSRLATQQNGPTPLLLHPLSDTPVLTD